MTSYINFDTLNIEYYWLSRSGFKMHTIGSKCIIIGPYNFHIFVHNGKYISTGKVSIGYILV